MDQKEPSLHEWYLDMGKQYGRQAARQIQSKLIVAKSTHRYNNLSITDWLYSVLQTMQ